MELSVKVFEMVARIESRQRMYVRRSFLPNIDDFLRDSYVRVKRALKELKEENRTYRN